MSTKYKMGKFVSITCYTYEDYECGDKFQRTRFIALDEFGVLWRSYFNEGWEPHPYSPRDPERIEEIE